MSSRTEDRLERRLARHVEELAERIGERNTRHPDGLALARAYLRRELSAMGYAVDEQEYRAGGREAVNLEVVVPGGRFGARALVVGAHYDTAPGTPGADDNASAVAILLEIARVMSGVRTGRDVRLVFYDCEEPPHFNMGDMGSQQHARRLREQGQRLLGMICLESLGYFPRRALLDSVPLPSYARLLLGIAGGTGVVVVSDVRSAALLARFAWSFVRSGWFRFLPAALPRRLLPAIELSDHRSYWDEGYPALMVTNTAFLRNPHYHQPTDRAETLDYARMSRLCRVLAGVVSRLAR